MIQFFQKVIEYVGAGNVITIITFILCLFATYYYFFKSLYRMVYSTKTICKTRVSFSNWFNSESELNTRILIYNNGRKTLSQDQIITLEITSSNKIYDIFIVKGIEGLTTNIKRNIAKISFENLDSSDYIVLETIHKGNISVQGRITETGKILDTEPKNWVIINAIFIIFLTIALYYNIFTLLEKDTWACSLNFLYLVGIFLTLRFIHSLLFIPDRLTNKYLETKDKLENEFRSK